MSDDEGDQPTKKSGRGGESKGDALVAQAKARLKAFSFWPSSSSKYEDAVELYTKAAAQYKIEKEWDKAAEAYKEAAGICEKNTNNQSEALQHYINAGKCYKNTSPKMAIKMFTIAVTQTQEGDKFSSAAKLWKDIAELEEKAMNPKEAIKAWTECANCYTACDSATSANSAFLKVAELAAEEEDYKRAIQIYEKVSASSAESSLGRWSVRDYLFKAILCHFVQGAKSGDIKGATATLKKYKTDYPMFEDSREAKLVENCLATFEDLDVEKFTGYVRDFDRMTKLDNWTAKILLEIKNAMKEGPGEEQPLDLT